VPSDRGNGKIVHGRSGVKEKARDYIVRWRRTLARTSSSAPWIRRDLSSVLAVVLAGDFVDLVDE
jgi:hypothetical protein